MKTDNHMLIQLREEAICKSKQAYAPYSQFRVGAAFVDEQGKIYSGANVENVSYGLTMCAERTAIFTGVAQGVRTIKMLVIYTPTRLPISPCGACRQVIREFSKDAIIISVCDTSEKIETTIQELLPNAFRPENMNSKKYP